MRRRIVELPLLTLVRRGAILIGILAVTCYREDSKMDVPHANNSNL